MRFALSRTLTLGLVAASIAASPFAAHADDHHDHGGYQNYNRGGDNHGGYNGGGYNRGGDDRRDHDGGNGLAGALLGLGVGALVGGAIISSQQPQYAPPPVYYAPPPPVYYAPPPPAYYAPPPGAYYQQY